MNEQQASQITASFPCVEANRLLMDDRSWQMWGYSKRPRYGSLISAWFRRKWRVELEDRLGREIFATAMAIDVVGGRIPLEAVGPALKAYLGFGNIAEAFGYATIQQAHADLEQAIQAYARSPAEDWGSLVLERIKLHDIPDHKTAATLAASSVKFAIAVRTVIAKKRKLTE